MRIVSKTAIGLAIMLAYASFANGGGGPLQFRKSDGQVQVSHTVKILMGPYYAKTEYWHEANTKKIHLEYTIIQNMDTCKKGIQEVVIQWVPEDAGVTWENHKQFTYQIKGQRIRLNSRDIKEIGEKLSTKE